MLLQLLGLDGWLLELLILIVTLTIGLYFYSVYRFNYWKSKGIPYLEGKFPVGTIGDVVFSKCSISDFYLNLYKENKKEKYIGYYALFQPHLLINDLDLIKNVLLKDFNTFSNRGVYSNAKDDPLSGHLFALEGMKWKSLRSKICPAFTNGKMKMMFNTMKIIADQMFEYTLKYAEQDGIINCKDITCRYGLDIIANVTLGLKENNFINDNTDIKRICNIIIAPSLIQNTKNFLTVFCKNFAKFVRLRCIPLVVENFFIDVIQQSIDFRKKNKEQKNDFMQILINMKKDDELEQKNGQLDKKDTTIHLTDREMAAQVFIFVLAGFETTSTTLALCLFELALNKDVQNKLIEEIDAIDGEFTFDILQQMEYLEMVLSETSRKYPVLHTLQRESSRDYDLPNGEILEKGTVVMIPVIGLHRNPELFPDPEKFDPERFNKENIKNILPFSYLPFGNGPRNCIGGRFAKMQIKLAVCTILSRCSLDICEKTEIPVKLHKNSFTLNPEGGLFIRITKRTN